MSKYEAVSGFELYGLGDIDYITFGKIESR